MLNKTGDYALGFALNFIEEYNTYICNSYIVVCENNLLKHAAKQVNKTILLELNFENLIVELEELLKICNDFSKEILIKKFKIDKQKSFENLLKNPDKNKQFKTYCNDKLKLFLKKIIAIKAPLTLDFKREDWFSKNQLQFSDIAIEPTLNFEKLNDKSVIYNLELRCNENLIVPNEKNTKIFAPELQFIIISNQLFELNGINSNKIKPFLDKNQVNIPAKNVNIYFEKFVKEVSNSVNIQAIGFDFQQYNEILSCKIELVDHFVTQKYLINLVFDYPNISFNYGNKKQNFSKIGFDEHQEVFVQKTSRNFIEEENYANKLKSFGFNYNNFDFFEWNEDQEDISLIDYIIKNFDYFKKQGIEPIIKINNKQIVGKTPQYKIQNEQKNDWFDIKITVFCGEFSFPFSRLINNLRKNDRFYKLPDDTYFLIPKEWFSKFDTLIKQATINDDSLKLPKSNFTVLEKLTPEKLIFEKQNEIPLNLELLKASLRPYQLQGVDWLNNHCINNFGACLADDMGLGKTLQIIALLVHYKSLIPAEKAISFSLFDDLEQKQKPLKALIVLPSSLVFNWANEFEKFAPHLSVIQFIGNERAKIKYLLQNYDVVLTTYGLIGKELQTLQKLEFKYLVLDESHRIKNINSLIFKDINELKIPYKFSLSGTPIENSLSELWAQMQFINPNILGSFKYFKENFIEPITKKQNLEILQTLQNIIAPFILRRTKEKVAPELPEKTEQIYYCELLKEQKKLYNTELSKARNTLLNVDKSLNKISVFNTLLLLRQISNHPKLINQNQESGKEIEVQSHLETLIKANQKVLIFSSFVQHLHIYTQWCDANNYKYCLLTGSIPTNEREKIVNNFINDSSISLFFISKKAGGEGLNLTVANYIVLLDPWWNPFVEAQAIARSHRIGQNKNVMVTRFITKDSIEEKILKLQAKKQDLFDQLIHENHVPEVIFENLEEIFEAIK